MDLILAMKFMRASGTFNISLAFILFQGILPIGEGICTNN